MANTRDARDPFAGLVPFVAVVEARSFRQAARRLGLTPSALSKAIAKLETELGVRLLHRTARQVTVTAEGALFYERARQALEHARAARGALAESASRARGLVRVSLPYALGRLLVVPALAGWLDRHPDLALGITFTDRFVRLGEEDIDVALRIGALEDSRASARRLPPVRWRTVAAPGYLARRGSPRLPAELADHDCLTFILPNGRRRSWEFRRAGAVTTVEPRGPLVADHGEALVEAALAGMGIVQAHDYMVARGVAAGHLVEVLAPFVAPGPPLTLLYAPGRVRHAGARAFGDFAVKLFR